MKKLVVASNNKGKLKEIKAILGGVYEVVAMAELGYTAEIEEDGETFYDNALIKAKEVSKALNCDALADDSGLCVTALIGAPGVYCARYSGGHGNDKDNNNLLLKNLEPFSDRSAKFVSSVVLYTADGKIYSGYGETHGVILFKEEGENGFGYDPLFYSNDLNKSFGIASAEEKNAVSHRYRALCDLAKTLGEN